MKKENVSSIGNGLTAVLMVNAVVFSLIAFNKKYKPFLDKMADQYGKLKNDSKTKNARKTPEYKVAAQKIFMEAKKELAPLKELTQEVLKNCSIQEISKNRVISEEVHDFLSTKLKKIEKGELVPRLFQNPMVVQSKAINLPVENFKERTVSIVEPTIAITQLDWMAPVFSYDFQVPALEGVDNSLALPEVIGKEVVENPVSPIFSSKWFEKNVAILALIVALNSFGTKGIIGDVADITTSIIEDLEEFFSPEEEVKIDVATYSDRIVHSELPANQKANEILSLGTSYQEKFDDIIAIEGLSSEEKIEYIIHSKVTNYENIFRYLVDNKQLPFDTVMKKIIHSGMTSYHHIFQFILGLEQIDMDIKMHYIIHSGLISNNEIFSFIFSIEELKFPEKMEYIMYSNIATYEELFELVQEMPELSVEEKVWYILLIPEQPFEKVLSDLLAIEGATQEQIIKSIIKADIVPFRTLFDTLLNLEGINKETFTEYLALYNSDYNDITLEAIGRYVFELDSFTEEEKVDCVWKLMDHYTLEEKENLLLSHYQITHSDYLNLFRLKPEKLTQEQKLLMNFYEKVYEEKENFTLEKYPFESKRQLEETIAGCAAEGCFHYDDLYGVANTIFNRVTHPYYANRYGTNPYSQFIAPLQFSVYGDGSYKRYLNSSKFMNIAKYETARCAFLDMFYANYDGIKHNYLEFRSSNTVDFSNNILAVGGNRYGVEMSEDVRIIYDYLLNEKEKEKGIFYVYESFYNK